MPTYNFVPKYTFVTSGTDLDVSQFGTAAKVAQRLKAYGIASPELVALSVETVGSLIDGGWLDLGQMMEEFTGQDLFTVFPSACDPAWGGPEKFCDVGMNNEVHRRMVEIFGKPTADHRYFEFIVAYASNIARLDPEAFENVQDSDNIVEEALSIFHSEAGQPFPQATVEQLAAVLAHMARAWESVSARLLRQAQGAPSDAGLGLLVQDHSWSSHDGFEGWGEVGSLDIISGDSQQTGFFVKIDNDNSKEPTRLPIIAAGNERSFQHEHPEAYAQIIDILRDCRHKFQDELRFEFAIRKGRVIITNAHRPTYEPKALVNLAVSLAEDGIISKNEALQRVPPNSLAELLHAKVSPAAGTIPILSGVRASPGGATGVLAFSSGAALRFAAKEIACILVRRETSPEDVRGLLAAKGIITERGGATSHAAVIARGLGVPCIAGVSDIKVSAETKSMTLADGRILHEGEQVTIDGSNGKAYLGKMPMREPLLDSKFELLLSWADTVRHLGVRANADTPEDAAMAQRFNADGIGLCRTEHMFFEPSRMKVMREMIFADNDVSRRSALDQLLPMQRNDFTEMYQIMAGKPVCIRLLDPPLHEFLPTDREEQLGLADALDLSISHVDKRIKALAEFNPMLGLRGVRLGITVPDIYEMQIRAIFEAAIEASKSIGHRIVPEIMIPLISTKREVDIVKKQMDRVAAELGTSSGDPVEYKLGVLLETPRAILRAADIVEHAQILSFGTNDLTQMTFGISRDDASRFMGQYLAAGAFEGDPFSKLDMKGVGELMQIGVERGRSGRPDVILTLCGEHAGEVEVIRFCEKLGFRYVSCSPFRVPIARLAAAQLAIQSEMSVP